MSSRTPSTPRRSSRTISPEGLAAELRTHVREQSGAPFEKPWPLETWPNVPTRFLLCRDDRFFPAEFQRRVVRERLGITPDEMPGGHLPALGHPDELVAWLERYRTEVAGGSAL
jgi:pimeloyl-ACP methyl ester carboxylesterase